MIDVRNDSYTGRSPCHDCQRHLDGLDKNDCVLKCARLAAYRKGEPWEGREIMEIKDENLVSNVEQKSPTSQPEICVICHDKDKKILNKRSQTCGVCYQRWTRGSVIHPAMGRFVPSKVHIKSKIPAPPGAQICIIDGCDKVVVARKLCATHNKAWSVGRIEHPTLGKYFTIRPQKPHKKRPMPAPETPPEEKLKIANESLLRSMTDKITKEIIAEITTELPTRVPESPLYPLSQGLTLCLDNYPKIKKAVYGAAEKYFLTPEHVIISLLGEALSSRKGAEAQK